MEYKVGVISGDGIGPEIVTEAKKVLDKIADKYGHSFNYTDILMGGCSIDATGVPLTDEAIATALDSDAVLMGSIGGNTATSPWYKLAPELRPEAGLLKLRKSLNLFANLRPAYLYKELAAACPLRSDIIGDGFDMMIMRELTGGLYFGARETKEVDGVVTATDTLTYNENEIRRIAKRGFDIAMKRRKKVTSVDKANVLDSSRLWRKIVEEVAKDYPEVTYEHMLVDNCAMQLVKDPKQFDVILTENMFGDILSDEAIAELNQQFTIANIEYKKLETEKTDLSKQQLWFEEHQKLENQISDKQKNYDHQFFIQQQLAPERQKLSRLEVFSSIRPTVFQQAQLVKAQQQLAPQIQQLQNSFDVVSKQFYNEEQHYKKADTELKVLQDFEFTHADALKQVRSCIQERDFIGAEFNKLKTRCIELDAQQQPLNVQKQNIELDISKL